MRSSVEIIFFHTLSFLLLLSRNFTCLHFTFISIIYFSEILWRPNICVWIYNFTLLCQTIAAEDPILHCIAFSPFSKILWSYLSEDIFYFFCSASLIFMDFHWSLCPFIHNSIVCWLLNYYSKCWSQVV